MKVRDVFLALLIIAGGIFLYYAKTGRFNIEGDGWEAIFGVRGEEYVFETSQEIPAPLPARLEVNNSFGRVEIEASESGPVTVLFRKRIRRRNKAEAQAVADALQMISTRSGDRLILSTNRGSFRTKRFETDFKIVIPADTPVIVKNSYGDVTARRTGAAELVTSHGRVSASGIAGGLTVRTSYEDVIVDGVQGDCRIDARHGQVLVQNIRGDLAVENSYGSVRAENAAKTLTIEASHSEITAKDIAGRIEIGSSYETIRVSGAAATKIRGIHCDVILAGIQGPLDIINDHGTVTADDIRGTFVVEGRDLLVTGRSITADEIRLNTTYQDVSLLDFSGRATIVLGHGDLVLRPRDLAGPIDVQGSYCAVTFDWPAGLRAPFEAGTRSGNIRWGLADAPALQQANGTSILKAFPEAREKPPITIKTSYGDIAVRGTAAGPNR
jgi:hypothetical protein